MPYRTVKRSTLTSTGFSAPSQGNSFYGADEDNHIHLGAATPPAQTGVVIPADEVQITYISIKINGSTAGRLEPGSDGRFWLDQLKLKVNGTAAQWPEGYKDKLREALGPMVNL